jgi:regulator of protease activity HflC (stomatin/prohibitin superfamily)
MSVTHRDMGSIGRMVRVLGGLAFIVGGLTFGVYFGLFRVYVPPGYCLVRIAKSGSPMPVGQTVADPGQKGIQRETWGPGRYFLNPIFWETQLVPLVEIKPGRPDTWDWVHTAVRLSGDKLAAGNIVVGELPEVGILTRKSGKPDPSGAAVVSRDSGYTGIIKEVLTPGVYRINPYEYEVQKIPAIVIPAGFVGVVTNQLGPQPEMTDVPDLPLDAGATASTQPEVLATKRIRPLAVGEQRGILRDVLPPGVYYLNPNVQRVRITEVGFNEFSQLSSRTAQDTIRFPSKSGFDIELGVTVVWGLHPQHAAEVINEFGNTDEVLEKVIKPQLRSICRNQGSLYEARDFIQGEKREEFQHVLTTSLRDICRQKNIELLLALISTIDVYSREGQPVEGEQDLKVAIQDSFLAIERQITNTKLQETEKKRALLEEAKKNVEVMRETIEADTRKKVATTLADGTRKAAETAARGRLEVAKLEQQIATIEAEKTELLGRAEADVEKLKKQAEADGRKMLVQAFGTGEAYNLYTFAETFEPESIRMIFAGPGTFWTDLKKFEEVGAAQIMQQNNRSTTQPAYR